MGRQSHTRLFNDQKAQELEKRLQDEKIFDKIKRYKERHPFLNR